MVGISTVLPAIGLALAVPSEPVVPCGTPLIAVEERPVSERDVGLRSCISERGRPGEPLVPRVRLGDLACEQYRDTEHFRIHFSARSGHLKTDVPPRDIAVAGDHAFLAADTVGLMVLDVSDPRDPLVISHLGISHLETAGRALGIAADGLLIFLAADEAGLLVIDVSAPDRPRIVGSLPIPGASRVRAAGGRAYVAGSAGLSVVDVTAPPAPQFLSALPLPWEIGDLELADQRVYLAADTVLVIADVSIPESAQVTGVLVVPGKLLDLDPGQDGYLQALGWLPAEPQPEERYRLWTLDITIPTHPSLVRTTVLDHVYDVFLRSGSIGYVAGRSRITSIDFRYPTHPHLIDHDAVQGSTRGMARAGDVLLLLDRNGVQVVDVTEPFSPRTASDQLPGWPDLTFVEDVGQTLETARALFHDGFGLRPPEPDGDAGGGENLVDCYVYRLEYRTWGFARPEEPRENGCDHAYSGYFALDTQSIPSYMPPGELAIHEYFHVVQFAHGWQDSWFLESTASWAPFAVVPASRSWLWAVGEWFRSPQLPLWDSGWSREYGSVHYWLFHTETTDPSFVPDVWIRSCAKPWREALEDELAERGRDFNETLAEFSVWNTITGERDDGAHYSCGRDLPAVRLQAQHDSYPVVAAQVDPSLLAQEAGSNYVRFMGPGATERLVIHFDGLPAAGHRRISFVATGRNGERSTWTLSPDLDGDCGIEIPDWSTLTDVTMIVTNFADLTENHAFTYSAHEEGTAAPPDLVLVAPNPARLGVSFTIRAAEETPVTLVIFDVAGRAIRQIVDHVDGRGYHVLTWDGLRERRNPTPAGVYYYDLRIGERSTTGRLVRLRP